MSTEVIAILAANGQQGLAVLNYFATHHPSKYGLRAIVRKPSEFVPPASSAAIKVVFGDYENPASLVEAFIGATYVFAMTNPDWSFKGLEETWGRNIAQAAKQTSDLKAILYSSVADAPAISGLECYNFAGKAATQRHMLELDLPAVFMWPGLFMQNFITTHEPRIDKEEAVFTTVARNDVLLPWVDIPSDLGPAVDAILTDLDSYIGKSVQVVSEWMTYPELARRWTKTTGMKSRVDRIGYEEYAKPMGGIDSGVGKMMIDMFKYFNLHGYYGGEMDEHSLPVRSSTTWEKFIKANFDIHSSLSFITVALTSSTTPTASERALESYFSAFHPRNTQPPSQIWALFAPDGRVEYPYAPLDTTTPSLLSGVEEIERHYQDWKSVFRFDSWDVQITAMEDGRAIAQARCEGLFLPTGKSYPQRYVVIVETREEDGKIVCLREYWDTKLLE
ncbi:hypothetical protein HKX48_001424 [Thoreauomyces humboldtii]|nr:hypothetical protein HKX48_001424 [Thoreauomyces humboldtii]